MTAKTHFILAPRSYGAFLSEVLANGQPQFVSGEQTYEIIGGTVLVKNPIDRLITARSRKNNVAFGFAEFLSTVGGIDDIRFFQAFIRDYGRFSSDGQTLDGAYGPRINFWEGDDEDHNFEPVRFEQLVEVERILNQDPTSRRAVISIYNREDLRGRGGKNTPCTLNLQFLIRDGRLDLVVFMRSSDVYKGLTYDLVNFTMIQEMMARRLDVAVGSYYHRAGSLHLYEYDVPKIYDIAHEPRWPVTMKPMPIDAGWNTEMILNHLRPFYDSLYYTPARFLPLLGLHCVDPYLRNLVCTMGAFAFRYSDHAVAKEAYSRIDDRTIRYVLRPWLVSAGVLQDTSERHN